MIHYPLPSHGAVVSPWAEAALPVSEALDAFHLCETAPDAYSCALHLSQAVSALLGAIRADLPRPDLGSLHDALVMPDEG